MTAKEKKETIEVLEKYIKYIEDNLTNDGNFLCLMRVDISKRYKDKSLIECGFNTRMLPNAKHYLMTQRPTNSINKIIYNKPCFNKQSSNEYSVWWEYGNNEHNIIVNTEKIDFLKHLISKLKK